MPRFRVLVLLAARNGSRWIGQQVDSILSQQRVDLRLIVRDDASTDSTCLELARFAGEERLTVVTATASAGSAARNFLTLIAENASATFDFVAFADQDDLWNPDKLSRACQMITSDRAVGYSSATIASWENGREQVLRLSGLPTASDFLFEGAGQGCTFVLTAALYERVRGFLATHAELTHGVHYHDWLVYALARSWELRWHFDSQPSMRYRQHTHNDTGARGTVGGIVRRLARIRDGWYGAQVRAIAGVCEVAAPANTTVVAWQRRLGQADGLRRRLAAARFCMAGGRRRARDNMMIVLAALCGWI
jgi:rhamnosyltransferase